jgi:hypothetical protein
MTLYRLVLKRAWDNTFKNRYLWFFGLFAAILVNNGLIKLIFFGGQNSRVSQEAFLSWQGLRNAGILSWQVFPNMGKLLQTEPLAFLTIIFMLLLLTAMAIFLIWLAIVSEIGLVNNAAREHLGKSHDLKDGINVGWKRFWPVLALNLLLHGVIMLMASILGYFFVSQISGWYYFAFYVLFVPLAIIFSFLIYYAIAYVVIKGEKVASALGQAWQLFLANWLVSLEMAFLLFAVSFVATLALLLFFMVLAVPFLFLIYILLKLALSFLFWLMLIFTTVVFIAGFFLAGSLLTTFYISAWTNLFVELISKGGVSKLERWFGSKSKKQA